MSGGGGGRGRHKVTFRHWLNPNLKELNELKPEYEDIFLFEIGPREVLPIAMGILEKMMTNR